jgi:hypothetical protein
VFLVGLLAALYALYRLFKIIQGYFDYLYYKKQGVVFVNGFTLFGNFMFVAALGKKYPTTFAYGTGLKEVLGVDVLPPITGQFFRDVVVLTINSVDYLTDIYVNKNMHMTKHPHNSLIWAKTIRRALVFNQT